MTLAVEGEQETGQPGMCCLQMTNLWPPLQGSEEAMAQVETWDDACTRHIGEEAIIHQSLS